MSKEREAFEAWVIENLAEGRSMSWEDWCWKAWQAAKAQAVPEGFILVPMCASEKTKRKMLRVFNESDRFLNCENIYKAMIESQQPSSTSGCPDEP